MINEEDLTSEKINRSVNRCIHELTRGLNDSISRWGDGKDLYMDINNTNILLIDPFEMTILHKQPIPSIRIWGVGRENFRFHKSSIFIFEIFLFFFYLLEILPMLRKIERVIFINVMYFDVIIHQQRLLQIYYVIYVEI
jgi:hypothetical protein